MKARWAGYFEKLYRVDPPRRELYVDDVETLVADLPISGDPPTRGNSRHNASLSAGQGLCMARAE